ncbi:ABC transporter permease [Streptomyces sp. NPDC057307]|uniref:ABC transporter permease n=1 Tax=Streptomyces sp. NPDC057307 TaxID=3346096 RepID=UPI0036307E97
MPGDALDALDPPGVLDERAEDRGHGERDVAPARRRSRPRRLLRRPGLLLCVLVLALALAWALAPGLFTGVDPLRADPANRLLPPGAGHPFGTDHLGRDLYARVVHGTALSLSAALLAVGLSLLVGGVLGAVAGTAGRAVGTVLMRLVDVLLAVPGLLLSLAVVSALGFGTLQVAVAVGAGSVGGIARVTRAEVLRVAAGDYVDAARLAGVPGPLILLRHVVPNAAPPVLVLAVLECGTAVLGVAALGFLGFGTPPPAPEWGALISGGRDYLTAAWWLTTLPGLVLVALVTSLQRVGRALEREEREQTS